MFLESILNFYSYPGGINSWYFGFIYDGVNVHAGTFLYLNEKRILENYNISRFYVFGEGAYIDIEYFDEKGLHYGTAYLKNSEFIKSSREDTYFGEILSVDEIVQTF